MLGATALADPELAATPHQQGLQLYKQATKMFEDEDFIAAAVTFGQVQAILARVDRDPRGAVIDKEAHAFRNAAMSNRATAYARAGLFVEALDAFVDYRAQFAAELSATEDQEVGDAIARMTEHVGTIELHGLPAEELEVRFDGRLERRDLARPLRMSEGPHSIDIKAAGYKPYGDRLAVVGKQVLDVKVVLVPLQTPAKLRIEATVGALVAVDGAPRGETPVELTVTPGHHTVSVAAESYATAQSDVEVRPGERAILRIAMTHARAPLGLRISPAFVAGFPLRGDTPFGSFDPGLALRLFHDAARIDALNLRFGLDFEYRPQQLDAAQLGITMAWCPDRFAGRVAWCPVNADVDYVFGNRNGVFVSGEAAGRIITAIELRRGAGFARLGAGISLEDYGREFSTNGSTGKTILLLWSSIAEVAVGLDL